MTSQTRITQLFFQNSSNVPTESVDRHRYVSRGRTSAFSGFSTRPNLLEHLRHKIYPECNGKVVEAKVFRPWRIQLKWSCVKPVRWASLKETDVFHYERDRRESTCSSPFTSWRNWKCHLIRKASVNNGNSPRLFSFSLTCPSTIVCVFRATLSSPATNLCQRCRFVSFASMIHHYFVDFLTCIIAQIGPN